MNNHYIKQLLTLLILLLSMPSMAYVGPGAGLSAVGTVIALIVFFILIFIGFIWYPVKRLKNNKKSSSEENDELLEDDFK